MHQQAGDLAKVIRRAKNYDQAAFSELYRLTVAPVFRYLSARSNSIDMAEELTQEVFLAALIGIEGLRANDEPRLMAWLLQIARHKLADHLRVRYRRGSVPLDEAEQKEALQKRPDEAAEEREERGLLRKALERLTPEQREVILAKFIMGFNNEQTAQMVGKNINAVNQLQHRALASLHRLLAATEKAG